MGINRGGSRLKEYLVLDGYNVINAWPSLKKVADIDLDGAREELAYMMAEYSSYTGMFIIIVFDAHLVKGNNGKKEVLRGVKIVYTKERETADSYIEKAVVGMTKTNRVVVATNDWAEQQMIFGGGATRISVRELILDYESMRGRVKENTSKPKDNKNLLSARIDSSLLRKLEKLRRS